jgi:hypothetical protein
MPDHDDPQVLTILAEMGLAGDGAGDALPEAAE